VRIIQEVDFVSDDPAFAGTMIMTWRAASWRASCDMLRREDGPPAPSRALAEAPTARSPAPAKIAASSSTI
jgi:hypothetical protein